MGYAHPCQTSFTQRQREWMFACLMLNRSFIWSDQNLRCTGVISAPGNISGNVAWNLTTMPTGFVQVPQEIHILANSTLTIAAGITVQFCENAKLVVDPGGHLILDGTLTNTCYGRMWAGVEVRGSASTNTQYPSMGVYMQERMTANAGSIIQNALTGIFVGAAGGGIVNCSGTSFLNNQKAVFFEPFENHTPLPAAPVTSNFSGFANCDFTTDAGYLGDNLAFYAPNEVKKFAVFADLRGIRGISFLGCDFVNLRTDHFSQYDFGRGILSTESGFIVGNFCTSAGPSTCPASNQVKCTFRNLYEGIFVGETDISGVLPKYYIVKSSLFQGCWTGIRSEQGSRGVIVQNTFEIGNVPVAASNSPIFGVLLESGHTTFTLQENTFRLGQPILQDVLDATQLIGSRAYSIGMNDNLIRKNSYQNLTFGNEAVGDNADASGIIGLRYRCNENQNNSPYDFNVRDGLGVRTIQGEVIPSTPIPQRIPAGNIFSHVILLISLLLPVALHSQTGLNKLFTLPGMVTTTINPVLVDQDTIVAFGGVIDVPGHYGVHISKYDSLGNLLSYNTYFHPAGKSYFLAEATGFIKTEDGGYLAVGDVNIGQAMVVFKFSHTGDLEWTKEISDNSLRVLYGFLPVECKGGYLIPGVLQYTDYDVNGFVYKISYSGEVIWRKDFGSSNSHDTAGFIVRKNDNTFFVSGGQNAFLNIDAPGYWSRSWVFEIDSTGALMSEWRSEIAEKLGICFIRQSGEQDLVFITWRLHPTPTDPSLPALNEFVIRKLDVNDWHTVWQTSQTGPDMTYNAGWQNLELNPADGAWDAVGTYQHYITGVIMSGITAHVNPDNGSTIWLRKDTAYTSPLININENHLRGIAHLSSGSIIAGGWVLSMEGGELHQEAWLLKISPDGCTEPGDCATVPTHEPGTAHGPSYSNWEVFPNPAKTYTLLVPDKDMQGKSGKIMLFNQKGSLAREMAFSIEPQQAVRLDLQRLSPGLYTYQVLMDNGSVGNGKIMVAW